MTNRKVEITLENQQAIDDRDWWLQFEVAGWQLCSFTDRSSAVFVDGTLSTQVDGMFMGHFKAKVEKTHATITVESVNIKLLRKQRNYLLEQEGNPACNGLISLLDLMLDKAEGFGGSL